VEKLIDLAAAQNTPVRELCATRFKDFQFGLKLISQSTGSQEFTIDVDAVEAPDKTLSEWVVAMYRK
jgi:ATP-dependent Clp protease ATP-binding subunit ClpX